MQITRSSIDTQQGSADWFTGDVYVDAVAAPEATSTIAAALVHFTPGARTAWHTHPHGQTIFVTEGVRRCQREGGPVEVIRPGDRVFFEPGENHWHGAAPNRFMVHIAMQQNDESGSTVSWGEHVTDDERSRHGRPQGDLAAGRKQARREMVRREVRSKPSGVCLREANSAPALLANDVDALVALADLVGEHRYV